MLATNEPQPESHLQIKASDSVRQNLHHVSRTQGDPFHNTGLPWACGEHSPIAKMPAMRY